MRESLPILYSDGALLVINKPAGLLVHRSVETSRREPAVLQIMRDQEGQHLYPVHRLDRPTSGILVLARSSDVASALSRQWTTAIKTYIAVVRGWPPETLRIDHALRDLDDPDGPLQEAQTDLQRLAAAEIDASVDRYPKARYALCQLQPRTGRRHQLRRHCKSIFHPMIGDTVYGHGVHNRFFREDLGISRLLLHHAAMTLTHPTTGASLHWQAPLDKEWQELGKRLDWTAVLQPWWPHSGYDG